MKLIVQEPFKWAHRGVEVKEYQPGDEIETEDADLITVSKGEGWAVEVGGESPMGAATAPADDTPTDPAPTAGDHDSTETPAAPKRGRGAK